MALIRLFGGGAVPFWFALRVFRERFTIREFASFPFNFEVETWDVGFDRTGKLVKSGHLPD